LRRRKASWRASTAEPNSLLRPCGQPRRADRPPPDQAAFGAWGL
jgi:hypothetical protein